LKEKNLMFFYWKFFFSDVQVPEHIWKELDAPFRKIWGQNISLRIRIQIRKKNLWIRIRKKWVRIHITAAESNIGLTSLKLNINVIRKYFELHIYSMKTSAASPLPYFVSLSLEHVLVKLWECILSLTLIKVDISFC
jgi:hypothetical protein